MGWLTSDDVRIPIRILGRDKQVHLPRSNGETLSERSIWQRPISLTPGTKGVGI